MNTSTKHFLPRIISAVIAVLLALTVAVPAMAEPTADDNLTITIKNNKGLPAMTEDMFAVYQLFKGTPMKENEEDVPVGENDWNATNWNNYVLADIEWGASVETPDTFIEKLQALDEEWAKDTSGTLFDTVKTAADLAKVLVGKGNEFMQHFAKWLVKSGQLKALEVDEQITVLLKSVEEKPEEDSLIYEVKDAGYYLLAETGDHSDVGGEENDAESEYIITVLGNQTINLKASIPTVNKVIKTTEGNVKGTSADINEELTFVIEGTLPKNYGDFTEGYEYIFHDSLPNSYSAIKNVVVTISTDLNGDGVYSTEEIFTLTADQYEKRIRSTTYSDIDCTQEFLIGKETGPDGKSYSNIKSLEDKIDASGNAIKINRTSKITVQYTTSLDGDAKLGNSGTEGNKSTVILQYSNDPNAELTSSSRTAYSEVYVYTYGLDLTKIGNDVDHTEGLGGAGFLLYKTEEKKKIYAKFDTVYDASIDKDSCYRFNSWELDEDIDVEELINNYNNAKEAYDNASKADRESSSSVVSSNLQAALNALKPYLLNSSIAEGEEGKILNITGIAAGEYALTEVVTPAGYNTMADYGFTITENINKTSGLLTEFVYTPSVGEFKTFNSSSKYSAEFETGLIPDTLENIKAPLLPFTGGIGTVIFYVLGGTLVAGAIVYIVIIAKKRRKETENSDK